MSPLLFSASIALALFVVAVDLSAEDKETELGEMKMSEVPTGEGFKFFAGAYDRSEFPTNFITIYTYKILATYRECISLADQSTKSILYPNLTQRYLGIATWFWKGGNSNVAVANPQTTRRKNWLLPSSQFVLFNILVSIGLNGVGS